MPDNSETPNPLRDGRFRRGGDEETRTPDPLHAKQVLYQLSYIPTVHCALARSDVR